MIAIMKNFLLCSLVSMTNIISAKAPTPPKTIVYTPSKCRVIIVGAGGQKGLDYLNEIRQRPNVEVVALVVNQTTPEKILTLGIPIFSGGDVEELLQTVDFDVAIVAVPHYLHDAITTKLLAAGKYVIKEKPLALTSTQARSYRELIAKDNISPIFTTVQRDTMPVFIEAQKMLTLIGAPLSFTYEYCFNLPGVTSGWRAKKESSGGGVVMDMGYHIIDVLNRFFGLTPDLEAVFGYKYESMRKEGLEDYAKVIFNTTQRYPDLQGTMILDRHAADKKEIFCIEGTQAKMTVTPSECVVTGNDGVVIKEIQIPYQRQEVITQLFNHCLNRPSNKEELDKDFERNIHNVEIIESIYQKHIDKE